MTAMLASRERHLQFSPDPRRAPTTQRYFLQAIPDKTLMQDEDLTRDSPVASPLSSLPPSPSFTPPEQPPYTPTTISSLSLDDDDLILPTYDGQADASRKGSDVLSDVSESMPVAARSCGTPAADDSSVEDEPSRHVDYLSHEWREEDIWASWRYVATRRKDYSNGARLENASWRTWAKAKHNLGTISPETLNWLKDCDVTWLYGPLKTSSSSDTITSDSPPPSRLETLNFDHDRKPILKKKTASEAILQRSLSQHTLLQHAGAILQAQNARNSWVRPPFPRSNTDIDQLQRTGSSTHSLKGTLTTTSSSGLTSPSERRHIHFNNEVEQCIAVECKGEEDGWPVAIDEESSSDDGIFMMQPPSSHTPLSNRSTPRNSFSSDSKTIAPLPSTTLKFRDTPEPRGESILDRWVSFAPSSSSSSPSSPSSSSLSPTPSVETLRPRPAANFLLDDDDEDPSLDFTGQYRHPDRTWFVPEDEDAQTDRPLQLTDSGMFMPYGEGEGEGEASNHSLLGRVVDTVNTARDIAHVIWNVGWRR